MDQKPLRIMDGLKQGGQADEQLERQLRTALDRILDTTEFGWVFERPVNLDKFPDYPDIVKRPMHLSAMREKIDSGLYATLDEFDKDFLLIIRNCRKYFAEDTMFYKAAMQLKSEGVAILKQIAEEKQLGIDDNLDNEKSSDPTPPPSSPTVPINCVKEEPVDANAETLSVAPEEEMELTNAENLKRKLMDSPVEAHGCRRARGSLRHPSSASCNTCCFPLAAKITKPLSELDIVCEVYKRPALWDRRLQEFKDQNLRHALWCEVGSILHLLDARERWTLVLNRFRVYHKDVIEQFPSLSNMDTADEEKVNNVIANIKGRRPWPVFAKMRFMHPFMPT